MDTVYESASVSGEPLDQREPFMATQVISGWVPGSVGPTGSCGRGSDAELEYRSPHGHERFTVLIVDDDESIAELLADLLEGEGYRAVIAHDGTAALGYARDERPDMILSDCMMPGLSGTQLAQELRRSPTTRSIALVLMSSTRPRDLGTQTVPFLAKPFEIDDVLSVVESYRRAPLRAQLYGEG